MASLRSRPAREREDVREGGRRDAGVLPGLSRLNHSGLAYLCIKRRASGGGIPPFVLAIINEPLYI